MHELFLLCEELVRNCGMSYCRLFCALVIGSLLVTNTVIQEGYVVRGSLFNPSVKIILEVLTNMQIDLCAI
jgi:hypothetical protein